MTIQHTAHDRVFIVYPFFAHYRAGVIRELLTRGQHTYCLAGDVRDPAASGIEVMQTEVEGRFFRTRSRLIRGRYLLQSGVMRLALRRDVQTIIYLGDVQHLTTWVSATLARLRGKRVLFWTHGWTHAESRPRAAIRRAFYKLAHGLLLYGHRARAIGIAQGFRPENLYVIYNSLDYVTQQALRETITPAEIARTRADLFAHPARPLVMCSSRLIPSRRLDLLLEAAVLLLAAGHAINILLVGDGPERAALAEAAERLGLAVSFFGACYDEAVLARLLSAADLTVIPGAAGLTVIHSLTYGTPVIAHDDPESQGPEAEAILPGLNGGLYKKDDAADLARLIRQWASPRTDAGRAQCRRMVDLYYNPTTQARLIDAAVSGLPADIGEWNEKHQLVAVAHSAGIAA
jgi:glycosyltransferase involved in cell wall biosynthesis